MLNFKSYNGKELQNFLAMLNQCETEGVTEIRFVREKIFEYIHTTFRTTKIASIKENPRVKKIPKNLCPSCGKGRLNVIRNEDGLNIVGCYKCRYSEIVKEI